MKLTDWQALDARLAREVMGWMTWDELSIEEQAKQFHQPTLWWRRLDTGKPWTTSFTLRAWQPHKDVAQAMKVKDNILKDDWCFDLSNRPGTLAVVYFWQMLCPMVGIQGKAETDAKAICLAAEAWLDAQKELQDAEGGQHE